MLSTKHSPVAKLPSGKLDVVDFYNKNKVGVDQLDEMEKYYEYKPISRRWTMNIFFWLLNVSAINAMVIYKKRNQTIQEEKLRRGMSTRKTDRSVELQAELINEKCFRKDFLKELSQSLMSNQKKKRSEENDDYVYTKLKEIYDEMSILSLKRGGSVSNPPIYCKKYDKFQKIICMIFRCREVRRGTSKTCDRCNENGCSNCVSEINICKDCKLEPKSKQPYTGSQKPMPTRTTPSRGYSSGGSCYFCPKKIHTAPCLGNTIKETHRFCFTHQSKFDPKYCYQCKS